MIEIINAGVIGCSLDMYQSSALSVIVDKFDASKPRSYMAFRAQWQNFEDKMTRANRSDLDKYYSLLRVVDGSAKNLIRNDYPSNDSYRDAMHLLDKIRIILES